MKKILTLLSLPLLLLFTLVYVSCDKKDPVDEEDIEQVKKDAVTKYAELVLANYEDAYNSAAAFKQAVDAFLAAPSQAGFTATKNAWLAARLPYGQSEAFRFYGGPIDDNNGPEGLINAWPMDEFFVDYIAGDPTAGIINNTNQYPSINKELLVALNELFSEESIFTGYHAAEFLLWGQDLNTTGPGTRPYTDYVTGAGGTALYQARRATYLQVVTDLLLENLAEVRDEWKTDGAYRLKFLQTFETKKAMGLIFSGLAEFTKGEIAGERMYVAIDLQDQEHEHSCFSDNTLNDLKMNLLGVRNVYFGSYARISGTTVSGRNFAEIAKKLDPTKAAAIELSFTNAAAKINAIPAPFDQTILNNTPPVAAAVEALQTLSDQLLEVGAAIGAEF